MKKIMILLLVAIVVIGSCTTNQRVRTFGGKKEIELGVDERLVNVTWKGNDLWLLTKRDTTKPITYTFIEKSSYGVWEGEIIIKEQ